MSTVSSVGDHPSHKICNCSEMYTSQKSYFNASTHDKIKEIFKNVTKVIKPEAFAWWLTNSSMSKFKNKSPIELIMSGEIDVVLYTSLTYLNEDFS